MPCLCNCHAHWTRRVRTWLWQWVHGRDPPVHDGWVDTRELFGDPPPKPWPKRIAGWIWSAIRNLIGSILVAFLLWLIFYRPYKVRPHVDAAALAAFDLVTAVPPSSVPPNATATSALSYDLALNVSFFNDHRIYAIRFDHLTAGLYYNGTKLGPSDAPLPSFKLHTRRHRTVYPVLSGRATVVGATVGEALAADRARGRIDVAVRVKTTLTYMYWPNRATYYYEYECWLQFTSLPPMPSGNGTAAAVTTGGVKCGMAK